MTNNIFYNVASQDISNGLIDFEISSGQDYLMILECSPLANLTVKLNTQFAPAIPVKENWQIDSANVDKIFLNCDAVAGGILKYAQGDGNLKLTPATVVNDIENLNTVNTINDFNQTLLDKLDKIINPYELTSTYRAVGHASTLTSILTLSNFSADYIEVELFLASTTIALSGADCSCYMIIDGERIFNVSSSNSRHGNIHTQKLRFDNLQNVTLSFDGFVGAYGLTYGVNLRIFNKKV